MSALTFGSLFSGIGGLDLGLERAGMVCRWQVEIDPWCRRVLTKHWPDVPKYGDIREVTGDGLERVDLLCGGFPCQDISNAGQRAGIDAARSGLWSEYLRLIRVVRPHFVLVENVAALLVRGLDRVLGDLAACGYDAEWGCIRTGLHLGHARERLFIVAYPVRAGLETSGERGAATGAAGRVFVESTAPGLPRPQPAPGVVRSVHGIPRRMDRIRGLGNAVVPQVAEWIGRRIVEAS